MFAVYTVKWSNHAIQHIDLRANISATPFIKTIIYFEATSQGSVKLAFVSVKPSEVASS